jgi:hypothetical protein
MLLHRRQDLAWRRAELRRTRKRWKHARANATIQRRRRTARSSAGATISQNGSQPNHGSMPRIAGTKTTAAQPAISQTCKAVIHVANSGVAGSKGMRGEAAIMTALRSSCQQASHA